VSGLAFRWLRFALGVSITALFLWLALKRIDFSHAMSAANHARQGSLLLALGCLALGYLARILRWWWMLRSDDPTLPLNSVSWPLIAGVAVNNVIPFRAGDAVRVFGFREQLRATAPRLAGSLVVERLLDTTVLLGLLIAGIAVWPHNGAGQFRGIAIGVTLIISIAWLSITVWGEALEERIFRLSGALPWLWARAGERHLQQFFLALGILRLPGRTLQLFGISIAVWICEGAVFASVAAALSYQGSAFGPWFACATGTLSTLIPSSPGYIGTFDYFAMVGLLTYGTNPTLAAAISFLVHAVLWVPLTLTGLSYMLLRGPRSRRQHLGVTLATSKDEP